MKELRKYRTRALAAAAAAVISLSASSCSLTDSKDAEEAADTSGSSDSYTDVSSEAYEVDEEDLDTDYDESESTIIALSGSSAEISGSGAECTDGTLTISQAGTYILSGSFEGKIVVDSDDSEIKLVLNGANVTSSDYSALLIDNAKKVTLTLNEGTENSFADGSSYTLESDDDNTDAAIFSRADLTINGSGTLNVTGNYKHGIVGKDDVVITGGVINVTAVSGGIYGKDCVSISDGTITVSAGSNGIRATNDEDTEKGYLSILGGTITVEAAGDGIEAETTVHIEGGDITVATGGGSSNSSVNSDGSVNEDWGSWDQNDIGGGIGGGMDRNDIGGDMEKPDEQGVSESSTDAVVSGVSYVTVSDTTDNSSDSETSAKGIKAGSYIEITGGTFTIDSSDDSIHSNGGISISGGDITATSGDDGMHADEDLFITGGSIDIQQSYEGIEGLNIYVSDGEISVVSSDDGFNAAGGSDTGSTDRMGRDGFSEDTSSASYTLSISGGTIYVDADGDGLDSNGDLFVSGGTIYVSGPTNSGNGALDYGDGNCTAQITGGTIIAAGAVGMEEGFDDSSTQYNVLYDFASSASAGDEFTVTDSDGNVILSYTFDKAYQSVVFSCPELAEGTYTLTAGDMSEELTISSVTTSNATSTMGGGIGGGMMR